MKIIEKLMSEGVIPYDIGTQLKTEFDEKVAIHAEELAEAQRNEFAEANEKSILAFMTLLKEATALEAQNYRQELETKVSNYMDLVVEKFVNENKEALITQVNESQTSALLEGFQAMMIAAGVELKDIQEEYAIHESEKLEHENRHKNELDELANRVIELEKGIQNRDKFLALQEAIKDLSELQKEKLTQYAIRIDDNVNADEFTSKIEMMKESLLEVVNENTNIPISTQIGVGNTQLLFKSQILNNLN